MKLINLFESGDQDTDWDEISSKIKNDCSNWLAKKTTIYRGMDIDGKQFIKNNVRLNDRASNLLPKAQHDHANNEFAKLFGKPYRNGLFVSTDREMAYGYGDVYVVFPIGNVDYIYSNKVYDFPVVLEDEYPEIHLFDSDKYNKTISEFIEKAQYVENQSVRKSDGDEIMIWCNQYYVVKYNKYNNLKL